MRQHVKMPKSAENARQLRSDLHALALQRGPEAKLPTVREICRDYSTNVITLDAALRELEARDIIYRRQGSGIFVSPRIHRQTVAVLLDSSFFAQPGQSPFWGHLWSLLMERAQTRGESAGREFLFQLVTTAPHAHLPAPLRLSIEDGRIHGVLGVGINDPAAKWLEESVPFVNFAGPGPRFVLLDSDAAVRDGVRTLAARGCRRISLWNSFATGLDVREIVESDTAIAFREELDALGRGAERNEIYDCRRLAVGDPPCVLLTPQEQGYRRTHERFALPAPPDGLIVDNDLMTVGVLAALRELHCELGRDVHLVSHTNAGSATLYGYEKYLDRFVIEPAAVADALFRLLDDALSGNEDAPRRRFVAAIPVKKEEAL